jgi:hypothetical protein
VYCWVYFIVAAHQVGLSLGPEDNPVDNEDWGSPLPFLASLRARFHPQQPHPPGCTLPFPVIRDQIRTVLIVPKA